MKYSVIMPTYNCEKYVEEAIKSVLRQTFSDFELIIVDDGSTDNTVNVATVATAGDNRARVIAKAHAGVSDARNRGIDEAKGEYLLFVDGDDTWNKNLLSECDGAMSDADLLIFGIVSRVYLKNGVVEEVLNNKFNSGEAENINVSDNIDEFFWVYNIASPCNKVYKKMIIIKNEIKFSEECCYLEDLKFNFDYMSTIDGARVLYRGLYYYRRFEENQVFKRAFKHPFRNADLVCDSATEFLRSKNKELSQTRIINGMLLSAYFNELNFWISEADKKTQIKYLKKMNQCQGYALSLKNMKGKASALLRVLKVLNLKRAQLYLIKKRFL